MVRLTDEGERPVRARRAAGRRPGRGLRGRAGGRRRRARGRRAAGGVPGPARAVLLGVEQPGELRRTHRRGPLRHGNQSTFPELAMDGAAFPSHRVSCVSPLPPPGGRTLSTHDAGRRSRISPAGWSSCTSASRCTARARRCWCEAGLGLEPWGVLHQGLAELHRAVDRRRVDHRRARLVLLLWIPLRQRPGLGTVSNVFVVGLAMDGTLALVPDAHAPRPSGSRCWWPASCSTAWRPASTSRPASARARATA